MDLIFTVLFIVLATSAARGIWLYIKNIQRKDLQKCLNHDCTIMIHNFNAVVLDCKMKLDQRITPLNKSYFLLHAFRELEHACCEDCKLTKEELKVLIPHYARIEKRVSRWESNYHTDQKKRIFA